MSPSTGVAYSLDLRSELARRLFAALQRSASSCLRCSLVGRSTTVERFGTAAVGCWFWTQVMFFVFVLFVAVFVKIISYQLSFFVAAFKHPYFRAIFTRANSFSKRSRSVAESEASVSLG